MSVLTPSVTRMTHLVLFHHVAGLTPGVTALADRWRAAGHEVTTPDLFEGRTFGSVEEGFAFVQSSGGFDEVRARALAAVADTLGVQRSANSVIAHTRKVFYSTATDKHNTVLLKVVTFTTNV